jgi:D-alanyl-D-alanine carboxypeptidase
MPRLIIFKVLSSFFLLSLLFSSVARAECAASYSALVFEENSDYIIFENQSDSIIYPASLVKLMTIYLAFEAIKTGKLKMDQKVTVSSRAEEASKINRSNTLHLRKGDQVSVSDAIKGSIVKSFNELTVVLAEAVSGSEWQFVRDMNRKAKSLEMASTNFRNSSGLPDCGQFTTDEDLKKLVMALRKDFPEHSHFFSLKKFIYKGTKYPSHNHVLLHYKGAEGMKTGFTRLSGFNLISSAKRGNKRVISILTGCESAKKRDDFTISLLDRAFKEKRKARY